MSSARWAALLEHALICGVDAHSLSSSPFLDATVDELIDRLESNGRFSFCGHVSTGANLGALPDVVAFPGDALGCCVPCARLHREAMQNARRRTCIRCDTERAAALHQATLGAVPGFAYVILAVPLCEECATAEGLRDETRGTRP